MVIPYNLLTDAVHSLTSIMTETKDKTDHMHTKFMRLGCLPLYYNTTIGNDATTVAYVRAKTAHKFHLNDYSSFKVAELALQNPFATKSMWYCTMASRTPRPTIGDALENFETQLFP